MTATRDVLVRARELVASGWTRKTFACDANGEPCLATSPSARAFSPVGAVFAVIGNPNQLADYETIPAVQALMRTVPNFGDLGSFNYAPGRTQAEVVAAFDRALEGT